MRTAICYFSGTGNAYALSKKLAEELGQGSSLFAIPELFDLRSLDGYDAIGVVCPVYSFGPPSIVKKFVKRLAIIHDRYFFGIMCYGKMSAAALYLLSNEFKASGLTLNYGATIKMPENYIVALSIPSENEIEKQFTDMDKAVVQIAADIKAQKQEPIGWSFGALFTPFYNNANKHISDTSKNFKVTGCIGCGTCESVCPVANIIMKNSMPEFGDICEGCLACLHTCPESAINYNNKTVGKKRYINPRIPLNELKKRL